MACLKEFKSSKTTEVRNKIFLGYVPWEVQTFLKFGKLYRRTVCVSKTITIISL